jgi:mRNA (guanine-N7-)-methyltransferase
MRKLNNWVKALLIKVGFLLLAYPKATHANPLSFIQEHCGRGGLAVLDLACGKGGDVGKWKRGKIGRYLGVDIARMSLVDAASRVTGAV